MAAHVAVVTDSASCLDRDTARDSGVGIAPLQVIVDGVAYAEGAPGLNDAVLEALKHSTPLSTSQPTPGDLDAAIASAVASGAEHVVAVSLSAGLSGTYDAWLAAGERAAVPVTVVDTRTVGLAAGFAALEAAAVARAGGSPGDVAQRASAVAGSSLCIFTVDGLEQLRRGGRLSAAKAVVGGALGMRPVLGLEAGVIEHLATVRTTAAARRDLVARALEHAGNCAKPLVGVMTLPGDQALAAATVAEFAEHGITAVATELSAVLAAHTGLGTLAIGVCDAG